MPSKPHLWLAAAHLWLAAGVLFVAASAIAQDATEPGEPPDSVITGNTVSSATTRSLKWSDIQDAPIITQNGDVAGQVADLILGPERTVDYVLGFDRGEFFPIPFNMVSLNRYGQVPLPVSSEQFEKLPFFTERRWPNFDAPEFRQQVLAVFGPTGRGPAPNANAPIISEGAAESVVTPAQTAAPGTPPAASDTAFPINNRISSRIANEGTQSINQPSPRTRPAYRGPAREPVLTPDLEAPRNRPDAVAPAASSGPARSASGPPLRASSTGEYNNSTSGATGATGGSSAGAGAPARTGTGK